MKTNHLLCPGDACPLRMTCQHYSDWLSNEDDEAPEMTPDYQCKSYDRKDYFYGG